MQVLYPNNQEIEVQIMWKPTPTSRDSKSDMFFEKQKADERARKRSSALKKDCFLTLV